MPRDYLRAKPDSLTVRIGVVLSAAALLVGTLACESMEPQYETRSPTMIIPHPDVVSSLVTRASFPISIAFTPGGRLFYNEFSKGNIMTIDDLTGAPYVFAHVDVLAMGECGLIGLAIDPEFDTNKHLFVYYVEPVKGNPHIGHPVLARFTERDGKGQDMTILIDDLPTTNPIICGHVSGNLAWGRDGYLYLSVGDMELKDPAVDLGSPLGKVLRIQRDGTAAPSNPFANIRDADKRIFAYGMRNPFGLAFDPKTDHLYQTENGASNCDEINVVISGGFYGHPQSLSDAATPECAHRPGNQPIYLPHKPGMEPETWGSNAAPVGIDFAAKSIYPSLGDALLYCEFNTRQMRRLVIIEDETLKVADDAVIANDCNLDVTTSPDGSIYYSNFSEIRRLDPSPKKGYPINDFGAPDQIP